MGRKSTGSGQHFCLCLALLAALSGCSLVAQWQKRGEIDDSLRQGDALLRSSQYEASLKQYNRVLSLADNHEPSDAAWFNIGLIYADPQNPNRNPQKAFDCFNQVVAAYPASAWRQQAQAWIGVLEEANNSRREIELSNKRLERSREELDQSQQELQKSKQELEKSKQQMEKTRAELERSRVEVEKSKQVIEKSRQVDIEIEQKKRARGR